MKMDEGTSENPQPPVNKEDLCFGPFRFQRTERKLWREDALVSLTRTEFEVLLVLANHAGQPVKSSSLLEVAWSGTSVHANNVPQTIMRLRRKMGPDPVGVDYIRTVAEGYVLAASLSSPLATADSPTVVNDQPVERQAAMPK